MKHYVLIGVVALLSFSGCSNKLDSQDRALLTQTRDIAEQARKDAAAARQAAENAAASARMSSERSDRIFRQDQMK